MLMWWNKDHLIVLALALQTAREQTATNEPDLTG